MGCRRIRRTGELAKLYAEGYVGRGKLNGERVYVVTSDIEKYFEVPDVEKGGLRSDVAYQWVDQNRVADVQNRLTALLYPEAFKTAGLKLR